MLIWQKAVVSKDVEYMTGMILRSQCMRLRNGHIITNTYRILVRNF